MATPHDDNEQPAAAEATPAEQPEPKKKKKRVAWGPRLLRYFIGLVVLTCVLGFGASVLSSHELIGSEIQEPQLRVPRTPSWVWGD